MPRIALITALLGYIAVGCGGTEPWPPPFDCTAAYACPGALRTWEPAQWIILADEDPADWVECSCGGADGEYLFWYRRRDNRVDCDKSREAWFQHRQTACGF